MVSQPTLRREGDAGLVGASSKGENERSRHQRLFEENVGKTKIEKVEGLRILKMRVRESFTHGEGKVLAPHMSITRDGSL